MAKTQTDVKERVKVDTKLALPSLFKVIYLNDDVTTVEFVIDSLVNYFGHSTESAEELASTVHFNGEAVASILPFELAEQKAIEVTALARANNFPLQIKIEKS